MSSSTNGSNILTKRTGTGSSVYENDDTPLMSLSRELMRMVEGASRYLWARDRSYCFGTKGDFVPENVFIKTVDTARLIPLDRTWTTHVYHHRSMEDRKLSMMPVVFTMVCFFLVAFP